MGSPSAELNVLESARPWYQSGLQYLFKDSVPGLNQQSNAVSRQPSAVAGVQNRAQRTTPVPGAAAPSQPNAARQPQPAQGARPDFSKTPPARPSRVPQKPAPSSRPSKSFPDPTSWPSPWDGLASRITPRLQIFWTYAQLGQDLSGQADAQRRKLFQSLIGYMGLPKGAISFWPCTTWNGSEFENKSDVFWKGVESYGVKFVACFGDQTRSIIAPDAPPNAASIHVNGVQLVMLQDPDFLKSLPPEEQQLLCISLLRLPLF